MMSARCSFDKKNREKREEKIAGKKRATQLINDCLFTIVLVMLDFLAKCHPSFSMYVFECQNKKQVYIFTYIKIVKMSLLTYIYGDFSYPVSNRKTDKNKKINLNIYIYIC